MLIGREKGVPQFGSYTSADSTAYNRGKYWLFDCSLVSTCDPLFNDCESNYEVEKKLRSAGVITINNSTDTESCSLVVRFKTLQSANQFISRLNTYLAEKARRVKAAQDF